MPTFPWRRVAFLLEQAIFVDEHVMEGVLILSAMLSLWVLPRHSSHIQH